MLKRTYFIKTEIMPRSQIKILKSCFNWWLFNPLHDGEVLWWGHQRRDGGSEVTKIALGTGAFTVAPDRISAYLKNGGYIRLTDTGLYFFSIVNIRTGQRRSLLTRT